MLNKVSILILTLTLSFFMGYAQEGYVVTGAKKIECPHPPDPREFKTKDLSWGEMASECRDHVITHGNWYKFYPESSRLRITVSTGYTFGDIVDPYLYIGFIDTVDGFEVLKEHACAQFEGAIGDFPLEIFDLVVHKRYYILVGGDAKKLRYALHLTDNFEPEGPVPPKKAEDEESQNQDLKASEQEAEVKNPPQAVLPDGGAIIIGRIRDASGKAIDGFKVMHLNDDLQTMQETETDEYGGFRFKNVNPDRINLIKMGQDDSDLLIDMFLYDENLDVIGKPIALGHRLHSFKARKDYFNELAILSRKDVLVDVEQGNSSMTGKVVDKETYLIGREGVKVGLYGDQRNLLQTAFTDLNGRFSFANLEEEEYLVKVEHNPREDYVEIVLADDMGVPYSTSNSEDVDQEGYFRFKELPKEEVALERMEIAEDRGLSMEHFEDSEKEVEMIQEDKKGVAIELQSLEFPTGSAELTDAKNDELDRLAKELVQKPSIDIKIDGHTDNIGSQQDNLKLSNERAEAVKAYLVKQGVAASRITCEGFGSTQPLVNNDTENGRRKNRRVEFTVIN